MSVRRLSLLIFVGLALALGGCETPRHPSSAAPSPTPSTAPAHVLITLTLRQQGAVAAHTLKLIATTTIANHLAETIGLRTRDHVPYPSIFYSITSVYGTKLWDNISHDNGGFHPAYDTVTIPPGGSFTWESPLDLSGVGGFLPGLKCTVVASVEWHTGTISGTGAISGVSDTATGRTDITVA